MLCHRNTIFLLASKKMSLLAEKKRMSVLKKFHIIITSIIIFPKADKLRSPLWWGIKKATPHILMGGT